MSGFERSEPAPGIRLVTERMPHVRSVAAGVWVDVGSRDEPDDLAGASHLLEHLLFKGTSSRSALDIAQAFDAVGGDLNAYSAKEHTCFYARVLDDDLPMAAGVLADMVTDALLDAEDLEAERKVVLEELRAMDDTPDDKVHDVFCERAWPDHALGRAVLGTEPSVGSIDRDGLAGFYGAGYAPGRLVVAAAGNLEHGVLHGLLASGIGHASEGAGRREAHAPPRPRRDAWYEPKDTEQVHIVWGGDGISRDDDDRYALHVLSTLYGAGMSSRLFQEVREKRGLVYSIFSYHHSYLEAGLFAVYAACSSASAAEVMRIVRDEAAAVASGDAGEAEVERAKGAVRGSLVLSMDDPGGRMSRLGRAELHDGEIVGVDELLERVSSVTPDDVARLARRMLVDSELVMTSIGPVGEGTLDWAVDAL